VSEREENFEKFIKLTHYELYGIQFIHALFRRHDRIIFGFCPSIPLGVVKTSFGHIPSDELSKRDVFITVIKNIFTMFYEKCKTASIVY
jgi:hypothetical protein